MDNHTFEGVIKKILFRSPKSYYSVLLVNIDGLSETVVGFFPIVNEDMNISFHGKREQGRRGKKQYKAESYSFELPKNNSQLYRFLTNDFIDLDLLLTMSILDDIGVDFLNHYSDKKYLIKKLTKETYEKNKIHLTNVTLKINQIKEKLQLMDTMVSMGFASDISAKISFSDFEITSDEVIKNPYKLIYPFDLSWSVVDFIALKNNIQKNADLRIHESICFILDDATRSESHIYLPKEELFRKTNRLTRLNLNSLEFKRHLEELEIRERVFCDIEDHIYGYRYYRAEQLLSRDLYRLHDGIHEDEKIVEQIMREVLDKEFPYSNEQINAIKSALINPMTIINGPAGSGKTTILKAISLCIKKLAEFKAKLLNKKITLETKQNQLCAPTGKSSERMKEVTGEDASTIHSLLSHNPITKFPLFNVDNPLPFDCLIIDEAGMIDTILFSHLLNAAKTNTKIIILGDVNQLSSIGPGEVLAELLAWEEFNVVNLTEVHRTGENSLIMELASKVKEGDANIYETLSKKTDELTFIENYDVNSIANQIVLSMEILMNKAEFDFYKDVQIISPIHKTEIGVQRLNERIQDLMNRNKTRKKLSIGNKDFFEGDKVMQTVNNKEKKVFNGETGMVLQVVNNQSLIVKYTTGKLITYTAEELFEIELAFAASVHKIQGSEASVIIFPVHSVFGFMLQRRLFYTAITRAKKKLLLIGQKESVRKAISNDKSSQRNCNLRRRLTESRFFHLVS